MNAPMKTYLRKAGLGSLWYRMYHRPKGLLAGFRKRNPFEQLGDYRARKEMEQAAKHVAPVDLEQQPFAIHFLSGNQYWYQTLFCAYTLMMQSEASVELLVYDDGSLQDHQRAELSRVFPTLRIVELEETEARLDQTLPVQKYPALRERRLVYPHIRKLTDIHAGGSGWKLVLDSDMLFFRKPDFLLNWLKNPQAPCHLRDIQTSYGYSTELLNELSKGEIPEKLNVGICGLKSDQLDWERFEYWTDQLMRREGSHYTQEQALIALYCSELRSFEADAKDYVVLPELEEVHNPKAVLHHYVANSKAWYFRYGWRKALEMLEGEVVGG